MREGYSETTSENADDSTIEAGDNFEIISAFIEDVMREIKNGHERTYDDQFQDLTIIASIFRATERLTIDAWTPHSAAICELLRNTASVLEYYAMHTFARWFKNRAQELDMQDVKMASEPTVVYVESPNSNHLLDLPPR